MLMRKKARRRIPGMAEVVVSMLVIGPWSDLPVRATPKGAAQIAKQAVERYNELRARAIEAAVRGAYEREFAESVPIPAIFDDDRSVDCKGNGHVTTTAYLRRGEHSIALLQMYLSRDGKQVLRQSLSYPRAPAGTFRTLVVIVGYLATVNAEGLKLFERAQEQINEDHAAFARRRGYRAPLVIFHNTNVVIDPAEIPDPRNPADVRAAAARKGFLPDTYRPVIAIDLNPDRRAGGFSMPGGDIYLGNYSLWKAPLGEREWTSVTRAAYHHEVAHYWGWDHEWSPTCGRTKLGFEPFIAPPVLFGWEDVDGDGVPEILDDTPYGRAAASPR